MKASNSCGYDGVNANMVKNGKSPLLIYLIKNLINAIISSGHIPDAFNRTIIKPILKDKNKKVFDPNNYRPISISNCIAQIFERVILKLSPNLQATADAQFGFKMGLSTYQPLFLVKETISLNKKSRTPCYVSSLDAEKAFDALWRVGLFYKLVDKIDKNIWLILNEYYNQSDGIIHISDELQSGIFTINRGVKQGGVLSPFLFNIYVNDLILNINNSSYGCYLGNNKTTILGYCDDLILMSSSLQHMQYLLNLCDIYSSEWKIKFNANKSIVINCGFKLYDDKDINLHISNNKLQLVEESKYLGLILNKNNDGNETSLYKYKGVEKCFFSLNGFGIKPPGVNPFVKSFIYNTYCLPKCTYGMGIFKLNKKTLKTINTSQNNLFRYALGLPYKCHISRVLKVLKILDAETMYLTQVCILIKLLHRHDFTKNLLLQCLNENSQFSLDIFNDIKHISNLLSIDIENVIFYPDKTRDLLINNYLNDNQEQYQLNEIRSLLENYTVWNKKTLIDLIKLEIVNTEDSIMTAN